MGTIAIIGASSDRAKFGNKAVRAYQENGDTVYPINPGAGLIEGLTTYKSVLDIPGEVELATLYVPPHIGLAVLEEIARKGIKRVLLNPGAASPAMLQRAAELGLNAEQVCSIVRIGRSPAEF